MSEETVKILEDSGWHEGRSINIDEIIENLEQLGYEVFLEVKSFLSEFGNLVIEDVINDETHDTSFRFTNYDRQGTFKTEEKYAQEKLVPVGLIDSDFLVLLVSESGKVYCSTGKLGDNATEAWERLINGSGVKVWGSF
ncbi:SUKH-3 domain-containing protein [Paenibacillus arenosi]|uniref:SUKH-3 domain-containing protein n=1 Tax=Paenibacillus arenosi TaxID=2774142 RepID=A0ABR9B4E3_9BACL|nr:SUKH-3 domain-containing protein [Paenibacillus arenosi]MBD8501250.1 SUKH-3 domain-containing protein [Paenibacillus arenosi]